MGCLFLLRVSGEEFIAQTSFVGPKNLNMLWVSCHACHPTPPDVKEAPTAAAVTPNLQLGRINPQRPFSLMHTLGVEQTLLVISLLKIAAFREQRQRQSL